VEDPSPPRFISVAASLKMLVRGGVQVVEFSISEGWAEPFADPFSEVMFAFLEMIVKCCLY